MHYLFGGYHLDTQRYELHHAGVLVPLRPKVYQVLAYLVAQHERVVGKEELLEALWPGQFVGDVGLNTYIMEVRKALGDRRPPHQYLRTVRGQGYRVVAPVEAHDPALPPSLPAAPLPVQELSPHPPPSPARALTTVGEATVAEPTMAPGDGEYKPVSVLCGGLRAAAVLAAGLDAEGLYRVMQTVVLLAHEVLQAYGGTLIQQAPEGFTAVFGGPMAQEDHARRAVRAALALQQRLAQHPTLRSPARGAGLALGIGIHSGLGVVGELGPLAHRQVTVVGAPVQGALRLQQQATPGALLVSAATYDLVRAEVRGTPCGRLVLEGWPAPLRVYAVQGLVPRPGSLLGHPGRSESPFVGRQREVALLHDRLALVRASTGQVLSVLGPPGIGKSRLLTAWRRQLLPEQVTWYAGQCLPYDQTTPYLPVRDILQQVCGFAVGDPLEVRTAAVRRVLARLGGVAEEDVALLLQVLDLPVAPEALVRLSPEARQARTFTLLGHLLRQAAQQRPLVLVVEDLHWIDPTSAAWLTALVDRLVGMAVLVLLTQRPGYQPPWGAHTAVTQLVLPPLHAADSQAIVAAVPGTAQLPAARRQQLVVHGAGNPFFVEELAWYAVEHDLSAAPVAVPETVHAVLAARIDRLPREEKQLLQTAAVIGHEIPLCVLQAIAELSDDALQRGLTHLQTAELLVETRLFPEREYTFKHALTHEVAYGSLLVERRRVLHARLVDALETLTPDRVVEHVERLAYHALRGEVWEKAVTYCHQAGARAYDRAAFREAVTASESALQALAHLPEPAATGVFAIDLRLALARPVRALGEHRRRLALLDEAKTIAMALDDQARLGRVLASMALVFRALGDLDSAMTAGRQALDLAMALNDSVLQGEASLHLGQAYCVTGDFGRAATLLRRNVEATDHALDTFSADVRIESQAWLANVASALGTFAEGRRHGEEALRLATSGGRGAIPIIASGSLGQLHLAQGDLEQAIRALRECLALCRASGNKPWSRGTAAHLGYASALQGHLTEGRVLLEEAVSASVSMGGPRGLGGITAQLSEVWRLLGNDEEARKHACQALDLTRQTKERPHEALALHQLGVVYAHTDPPNVEQAEAHYRQALALAEELGMRPLQAHCHRSLGTLYATTGQQEQARTALSTAIEMYQSMDMTLWLPQTDAALAQVDV